jgi:hypothetical protein
VDAAVFEAVPFRSAIADGCTHLLVLCTRPARRRRSRVNAALADAMEVAIKKAVLSPDYMVPAWKVGGGVCVCEGGGGGNEKRGPRGRWVGGVGVGKGGLRGGGARACWKVGGGRTCSAGCEGGKEGGREGLGKGALPLCPATHTPPPPSHPQTAHTYTRFKHPFHTHKPPHPLIHRPRWTAWPRMG